VFVGSVGTHVASYKSAYRRFQTSRARCNQLGWRRWCS